MPLFSPRFSPDFFQDGAEHLPAFVQDLIKPGVVQYDLFVSDGQSDVEGFRHRLKIHQQGRTDYMTFCKDAAETGIGKWRVDMGAMTCTYYDTSGSMMLAEKIPGA